MTALEYLDQLKHEGRWTLRDQQMVSALALAPWWTTVQIAWSFFRSERPLVLARRRLQKLEEAGILTSRRWQLRGSGGPPSKVWSVVPAVAEALGAGPTVVSTGDAGDWAWAQCLTMEYTFPRFRRKIDTWLGASPVEGLGSSADLVTVRFARNGLMHAHYWTYLLILGRPALEDPSRVIADLRQFREYAVSSYPRCALPGKCRWRVLGQTLGSPWADAPMVSRGQWLHWLRGVRWLKHSARWRPTWEDLAEWPLPLNDIRSPDDGRDLLDVPVLYPLPVIHPLPVRTWTPFDLAEQDCGVATMKRPAYFRNWARQWHVGSYYSH